MLSMLVTVMDKEILLFFFSEMKVIKGDDCDYDYSQKYYHNDDYLTSWWSLNSKVILFNNKSISRFSINKRRLKTTGIHLWGSWKTCTKSIKKEFSIERQLYKNVNI